MYQIHLDRTIKINQLENHSFVVKLIIIGYVDFLLMLGMVNLAFGVPIRGSLALLLIVAFGYILVEFPAGYGGSDHNSLLTLNIFVATLLHAIRRGKTEHIMC